MPSTLNESWRPSYHHVTDCVITGKPVELARNKSAIQSSTKQPYIAKKAVDGVLSSIARTKRETEPFWSVDLGTNYYVYHLYIKRSVDSNGELILMIKIVSWATYMDNIR